LDIKGFQFIRVGAAADCFENFVSAAAFVDDLDADDSARFEKKWADCKDAFEQLIFLFKNINTLHKMPVGCKDKALEAILKSAKISKLSAEELMDYERQKKVMLNRVKELVKSGLSGEELLERLESR